MDASYLKQQAYVEGILLIGGYKPRVLHSPGPSDPERGELSLGRFAVGGPTSSRLSAILVGKYDGC